MRAQISLPEARRIALAAAGFGRPRPSASINAGHMARVIRRLGLLQLDYVNVLAPAHLFVMFSRLGPYDKTRFHRLVYAERGFTEHWAHEASIVPSELWPLLEYRRQDYRPYPNSPIMKLKNKSAYLRQVYNIIKEKAPLTSADLPQVEGSKRKPGDWHRSLPRWALEYYFGKGQVTVADRLPNFQRVYDLPERQIDSEHLGRSIAREEAQRQLILIAASALGVATADDLADYYRMSPKIARGRIAELTAAGLLQETTVESWPKPAYLSPGTGLPRSVRVASLLSPFDPLVWYRPRAKRLFDFHYRIEIYVPAAKRKWGYYVLPFLLDDRIVARLDLKADRTGSTLLVPAAHPEKEIDEHRTISELGQELRQLANWLELEKIKVFRRGKFARALADYVRVELN
ncbi:MAG: winged helix-turn-helix domain-containing protein [Woeseiaceae bacterium]